MVGCRRSPRGTSGQRLAFNLTLTRPRSRVAATLSHRMSQRGEGRGLG